MAVQRFQDSDEARRALWVQSGDPSLARRIRALWARAGRLAPSMIPRGLRKFGSIEAAGQEREAWTEARVSAFAAHRKPRARAD